MKRPNEVNLELEDLSSFYAEQGLSPNTDTEKYINKLEQRLEAGQHETIVKCPLPDVFGGDLNTRRIEKYQEIKKRYMVSEGTVRDLFNAGIDWYKQIIEESVT